MTFEGLLFHLLFPGPGVTCTITTIETKSLADTTFTADLQVEVVSFSIRCQGDTRPVACASSWASTFLSKPIYFYLDASPSSFEMHVLWVQRTCQILSPPSPTSTPNESKTLTFVLQSSPPRRPKGLHEWRLSSYVQVTQFPGHKPLAFLGVTEYHPHSTFATHSLELRFQPEL